MKITGASTTEIQHTRECLEEMMVKAEEMVMDENKKALARAAVGEVGDKANERETVIRLLIEVCGWDWWQFEHHFHIDAADLMAMTEIEWRLELEKTLPTGKTYGRRVETRPAQVANLCPLPALTTDETDCFKHVVPAMFAKGYFLELFQLRTGQFAGNFTSDDDYYLADAHDTPAAVICDAAIKYLDASRVEAPNPSAPRLTAEQNADPERAS